jgi:hypothetical protein
MTLTVGSKKMFAKVTLWRQKSPVATNSGERYGFNLAGVPEAIGARCLYGGGSPAARPDHP